LQGFCEGGREGRLLLATHVQPAPSRVREERRRKVSRSS